MDDRLLQPFLAECLDVVDRLREEWAAIETAPSREEPFSAVAAQLGDLKVGCGFLGLSSLGSIVLTAESAVEQTRSRWRRGESLELGPTADRLDELADGLRALQPHQSIVPIHFGREPEPVEPTDNEPETYPLALYVQPEDSLREPPACVETDPVAAAAAEPAKTSRAQPHVLVVDDSLFYRELLRASLEDAGCRVTTAEAASETETLFASEPDVDVVVSEIALPDVDGCAHAESLRTRFESLPLIALVAGSRESERTRALEAGFDCFLVKYRTRELVAAIDDLLPEPVTSVA